MKVSYDIIDAIAEEGLTDIDACKQAGVSMREFLAMRRADSDYGQAYEDARLCRESLLEHITYHGGPYKSVDEEGNLLYQNSAADWAFKILQKTSARYNYQIIGGDSLPMSFREFEVEVSDAERDRILEQAAAELDALPKGVE